MGPGIIIPLVVLAVVVPAVFLWAKKLKDPPPSLDDDVAAAPAARLTSNALRDLATPPWRVVYEIAPDKLGGIEHVLIGPAGAFAVQTSMDPLPDADPGEPEAHAVANAAIARGGLDDTLHTCAMSSDRLVRIHWGAGAGGSVELLPGMTAVDGRSMEEWADSLDEQVLTPAQVDLAWQTVLTSIGRPDPLA